jgi:RNA polymerase sigma factor (sigma-70 family)
MPARTIGSQFNALAPAAPSLEQMFATMRGALVRVALRFTRNYADAEDVVQTVFLRAARHRETLPESSQLRFWLSTAVRRAAIDTCRRAQTRQRALAAFARTSFHVGEKSDHLDLQAKQLAMYLAIRQLPPKMRTVVELRVVRQLPYDQIACLTGMPAGTVATTLSRARVRLSRLLRRSVRIPRASL